MNKRQKLEELKQEISEGNYIVFNNIVYLLIGYFFGKIDSPIEAFLLAIVTYCVIWYGITRAYYNEQKDNLIFGK